MPMLNSYAAQNKVGHRLEYVNLDTQDTNLNIRIRLYSKVKDAEPSLELYESFFARPIIKMSISSNPKILESFLSENHPEFQHKDLLDVVSWILDNQKSLLLFWNEGQTWKTRKIYEYYKNLKKT